MELVPLVSPIGLIVVLVGLRLLFGTIKTVLKLLVVVAILVGLYIFFYGGTL